MKNLLITLIIFLSSQSWAQDTIVHKSGEIEAVKILSLDLDSKLLVYSVGNDTIYTTTDSIDRYILHSDLGNSNIIPIPGDIIENSKDQNFKKRFRNTPLYDYGNFSISTNLTALANILPTNSRVTIEPELQLINKLSIKIPLTYGFKGHQEMGVIENLSYSEAEILRSYDLTRNTGYFQNQEISIKTMPKR